MIAALAVASSSAIQLRKAEAPKDGGAAKTQEEKDAEEVNALAGAADANKAAAKAKRDAGKAADAKVGAEMKAADEKAKTDLIKDKAAVVDGTAPAVPTADE